jgi:methionyl-tRNA formyltransferase
MNRRLVLLTPFKGAELARLTTTFSALSQIDVAATLADLERLLIDDATTLLAFGSGAIVPRQVLGRLRRPAYNVHAGSPEFPGRDPHHHAVYRGARIYGATLHIMTPKVDDGPIVGVELFPVPENASPAALLAAANEAGFQLIERVGPSLLSSEPLPILPGISWGSTKTRRADLQRLSRVTPLISEAEFDRRFRAFDGGAYDNLTVTLHGRNFRIDKCATSSRVGPGHFDEFTERGFRGLIRQLKTLGYRFARYGEGKNDRHVIWRHDVDFSPHRAAALAAVEADEGVIGTYFITPRSTFYNAFEPEIEALLHRIAALGHEIGLHFDAGAYSQYSWDEETLLLALSRERKLLESLLQAPIRAVSWHNPDMSNLLQFDAEEIGGLINAYGGELRRTYHYCSDSNGYWRFKPMAEVIREGHPRLHLLTHPCWWTPESMAPSARIDRAILGRARRVRANYDNELQRSGRTNVD